ncbi:MAG: hypothetical protein ACTHNP_01855 [Solirubrobacterales bacterium]
MEYLRTLRHVLRRMLWWHRLLLLASLGLVTYASIRFFLDPSSVFQLLVLALVGLGGVRLSFVFRWRHVGRLWDGMRQERTTEALHGEAQFSGLLLLVLLVDPDSGSAVARVVERSRAETLRRLSGAPDRTIVRTFVESSGRVFNLVPPDRELDASEWEASGTDLVESAESTVISWGLIQSRKLLERNLDLCVQAFIAVQERALAQ